VDTGPDPCYKSADEDPLASAGGFLSALFLSLPFWLILVGMIYLVKG
jgi:hypothetical protein